MHANSLIEADQITAVLALKLVLCLGLAKTHLDRVEAVLEDSVQHLAVEPLLLLQILLQLNCDGIEALGACGGVHGLTPISWQQVVNHHTTQPLPLCIHPAPIQTHITHALKMTPHMIMRVTATFGWSLAILARRLEGLTPPRIQTGRSKG